MSDLIQKVVAARKSIFESASDKIIVLELIFIPREELPSIPNVNNHCDSSSSFSEIQASAGNV